MSRNKNLQARASRNRSSPDGRPRRWLPIAVGLGLGVVLLGGVALLGPSLRHGQPAEHAGSLAPGTTTLNRAVGAGLPPPAPGTRTPINDADPLTGKALTAASPTLAYKGYTIGFCCDQSPGFLGGWERMSATEKDAFVRKYLK